MGRAVNRGADPSTVNAWRVAHSGLVMGAVLLLSVSAVLPKIALSPFWEAFLAWSFIASAYGFIVALPYGAAIGERGLRDVAGRGRVVYVGNVIGAAGSLAGGFVLTAGSFRALAA